jgi:hypothetical protein
MLIGLAWRRHLILDVKSGIGGIPGMRHAKQDEARRTGSADATVPGMAPGRRQPPG